MSPGVYAVDRLLHARRANQEVLDLFVYMRPGVGGGVILMCECGNTCSHGNWPNPMKFYICWDCEEATEGSLSLVGAGSLEYGALTLVRKEIEETLDGQ